MNFTNLRKQLVWCLLRDLGEEENNKEYLEFAAKMKFKKQDLSCYQIAYKIGQNLKPEYRI